MRVPTWLELQQGAGLQQVQQQEEEGLPDWELP